MSCEKCSRAGDNSLFIFRLIKLIVIIWLLQKLIKFWVGTKNRKAKRLINLAVLVLVRKWLRAKFKKLIFWKKDWEDENDDCL